MSQGPAKMLLGRQILLAFILNGRSVGFSDYHSILNIYAMHWTLVTKGAHSLSKDFHGRSLEDLKRT